MKRRRYLYFWLFLSVFPCIQGGSQPAQASKPEASKPATPAQQTQATGAPQPPQQITLLTDVQAGFIELPMSVDLQLDYAAFTMTKDPNVEKQYVVSTTKKGDIGLMSVWHIDKNKNGKIYVTSLQGHDKDSITIPQELSTSQFNALIEPWVKDYENNAVGFNWEKYPISSMGELYRGDTLLGYWIDYDKFSMRILFDKNARPFTISDTQLISIRQASIEQLGKIYEEKFTSKINPDAIAADDIQGVSDIITTAKDGDKNAQMLLNTVEHAQDMQAFYSINFFKEPNIFWIYQKDKTGNMLAYIYNVRPKNNRKQTVSAKTFAIIEDAYKKLRSPNFGSKTDPNTIKLKDIYSIADILAGKNEKWVQDYLKNIEHAQEMQSIYAVLFANEPHIAWIYQKDNKGKLTAYVWSDDPVIRAPHTISPKTWAIIEQSQEPQYQSDLSAIVTEKVGDKK